MIVEKDKVVSLTYTLRLDQPDGEIVESLNAEAPLTFLFGGGGLLPKFEDNISGLKVGDNFDFNLASADAYGEVKEEAIVNIPLSAFEVNGKVDQNMLSLGNRIPMQDTAGNKLTGIVKEVSDENVKMDFNHPLAGNDLFFQGEITEVRDATDEEMTHGHAHYPGSCEGCNCSGDHDSCEDKGGCC
ncbi:MAG: peptidylprolyl isomerase [Bacteroidales bacterium]|nr:peptidylprolyl isomerase [Bacteroidales bacterium]